jgi:hypothetical protein
MFNTVGANRGLEMNFAEKHRSAMDIVKSCGFFAAPLALCASLLVISSTQAAEWSLGPEVKVGARYEDNPRLVEDGSEDDITGGFLDLEAVAARRTETSTFEIRPRLYFDRYDESDEDSDDQYLDTFFRSRGQRSTFDFRANISNQQVRRGETSSVEFAESELDEEDESTSGRLDRRRDRLRWRVRPEYAFDLTQRTKIGIGVEYVDVDYNNEELGEASDYWYATGELFAERALSQKNRIRLTAFTNKYDNSGVNNDSTSFGGSLRFERELTETFKWYASGGAQRTNVEAGDDKEIDDNQTSYIFTTGVNRQWERTRLLAEASRSVDPSGSGFLKTRDGVRINLRHEFRPRWAGELGVYAFRDDNLDDALEINKRDYASSVAKLSWQMSRVWFVEGSYAYTYQDYEDTPGDADSNSIALSVVYRPFPKTWSR